MPKQRSPNRDKAFEVYKEHNGDIDLVKIAEILNLSPGTIRGWKNKDKWDKKLNGAFPKKCNENMERSKHKAVNKKSEKELMLQEVEEVLSNTELTEKQRLFCVYYINCFNATKAYKKAYGCDYITANTNGPRLLVNACIKKEIKKLKTGKLNKAMLNPYDIFQKYMDIAFSDITDYVEFGQEDVPVMTMYGPLTDKKTKEIITHRINTVRFKESTEVDGTLISEVSQGKDGAKIKLQDRMKALDWIADHMDMANEEQKARIEVLKSKVPNKNNTNTQEQINALADLISNPQKRNMENE